MANITQRITNCLWFNSVAEDAVRHYTAIFKNSSIGAVSHYTKAGFEHHGKGEGTVLTISFTLDGQQFLALNAGPEFRFNEAMSLMVGCDTQEEIDYYWSKLTEGGEEGPCGWCKDKFGVSWQVYPVVLSDMMVDSDKNKVERVTAAYMQMKKFDIQKLKEAFNG
ncbi:MAG: VOC family protein [Bacteroidota bacterium]